MAYPTLYIVPIQFHALDTLQLEHVSSLMDKPTMERAHRFYHQQDSWRFVIGRMLRVVILSDIGRDRGITSTKLEFGETPSGKPYLVSPSPLSCMGFNVSHDNAIVLMGISESDEPSGVSMIGVDIMKAEIPANDDILSFIASVESTLTPTESRHLRQLAASDSTHSQATKHLFRLWTLKEAYVKALGVGITFELSRIQFEFDTLVLTVEGKPLERWGIISFELTSFSDAVEPEEYVGAICYQLHGSSPGTGGIAQWVLAAEDERFTFVDQHHLIQRFSNIVASLT